MTTPFSIPPVEQYKRHMKFSQSLKAGIKRHGAGPPHSVATQSKIVRINKDRNPSGAVGGFILHRMAAKGVTIKPKNKPKTRSSSKSPTCSAPAATDVSAFGNTSTSTTATTEYFSSSLKARPTPNDDNVDEEEFAVVSTNEEDKSEEEEEDAWEEVEDLPGGGGLGAPAVPAEPKPEPVEVELETPDTARRRRWLEKRKAEWEAYLRREANRYSKELQVDTHKAHLVCLLAAGVFRNRLCGEPTLLAMALSLLPAHFCKYVEGGGAVDEGFLAGLLRWFRATFTLREDRPEEEEKEGNRRAVLERRLAGLFARDHQEMTHLFLLFLRSLRLSCRLVLCLRPVPLKAPKEGSSAGPSSGQSRSLPGQKNASKDRQPSMSSGPTVFPGNKRRCGNLEEGGWRGKKAKRESEPLPSLVGENTKTGKSDTSNYGGGRRQESGEGKRREAKKNDEERDSNREEEVEEVEEGSSKGAWVTNARAVDEWLEVHVSSSSTWVCVDVLHGVGRPAQDVCSRSVTGGAPPAYVVSFDGAGRLKDLGAKYDPAWMTAASRRGRLVVGDDGDGWWEATLAPFLGDHSDEADRREDAELSAALLDRPLPTSVADYKRHPLYVLERHLLKYEALYPPAPAVLGRCRGEPVYSRDCVRALHSRDAWMKEARAVRPGEEPYKMVKGFSNRSRKARTVLGDHQREEKDLALYGEWQTEEYQPEAAVDGKVPRNEYGNVYLFKPCMLPLGCVHLQLPGLHRVARRLELDAAPAVTGFDFHGGFSHAVTDGHVVCEEHAELLRAAWLEECEARRRQEREKRRKRALCNWRLLVRGLVVRERVQRRYGDLKDGRPRAARAAVAAGAFSQGRGGAQEGADGLLLDDSDGDEGQSGTKTAAEALATSWPQNRQDQRDGNADAPTKKLSRREEMGQRKHLCPFERREKTAESPLPL